jgi:hypothetical protein
VPLPPCRLALNQRCETQTQNEIIERQILPQLEGLFHKLIAEKRDMTIDGTKAFSGDDHFLPGKVALGLAHVLINTPRSDPRFATYLAGYREIADLTVDDVNETWGVYYYMSALNKLRKAGLLDEAIRPETLARLRQKLDWRPFVRVPEFTLVNLPTNYYGVAFSIARLRMLMGWEDDAGSRRLLQEIVDHYQQYSGDVRVLRRNGRRRPFRPLQRAVDRRNLRAVDRDGHADTPQLKAWLRKSADLVLVNLNRSRRRLQLRPQHRPYADTAFLEVLSASAYFDVLSRWSGHGVRLRQPRGAEIRGLLVRPADGLGQHVGEGARHGRVSGKARILGENFSLSDQLIKTNDVWNRLGYKNRAASDGFDAWLAGLQKHR